MHSTPANLVRGATEVPGHIRVVVLRSDRLRLPGTLGSHQAWPQGREDNMAIIIGKLNECSIFSSLADSESRESPEEAFKLAALKAYENNEEYGLYCQDSNSPYAVVGPMAWGKINHE